MVCIWKGCVRAVMVDGNLSDDAKHTAIKTELDQDPLAWIRLANATDWVGDRVTDRSGWVWQMTDSDGEAVPGTVSGIEIDSDINWIGALI